jgi:two-component system chemotaxis response regulator CheY
MATILVVDDHSTSQRLMSFILQQHGHTPVTAMNGRQALERLAEQQFELVITDLNMPELDGLALLQQMRANPRYHRIPVAILTGGIHEQDNLRPYMGKKMAFLTKPVGSDEVMAAVNRLLAEAEADDPPSEHAPAENQDEHQADGLKLLALRLKQKINVI